MAQKLWSAALVAVMSLIGASNVSAQSYPARACVGDEEAQHTRTSCGTTAGTCAGVQVCTCAPGYHMDGTLSNGDPDCVRNDPTICDPEVLGTRRVGRHCVCTAENVANGNFLTSRVLITRADRRAHGWSLTAPAEACVERRDGPVAPPFVAPGPDGEPRTFNTWSTDVWSWLARLDLHDRSICNAPPTATEEEIQAACVEAGRLIALIPSLVGPRGPTTIVIEGNTVPLQDGINTIVGAIGGILERLTAVEERVGPDDGRGPLTPRVAALEAARNAPSATMQALYLRLGGFGRLAFTTGPATGAGGAVGELLIRFGAFPLGWYARVEFGAQETGWGVGNSMFLGGSTGFSYFTGGPILPNDATHPHRLEETVRASRRSSTISLGFIADDLLEPFADAANEVQGSHLGVSVGAELSASIPLPGDLYWLRVRPGITLGYTERYFIANGAFSVGAGVVVSPSLAIEIQPDL